MEMTPDRWRATAAYLAEVFGPEDGALVGLRDRAKAAGLPPIAISADVGRLLEILAATTRGRIGLEVGTLGGYSALWIARGLRQGGVLHTIERSDRHADFAEAEFARSDLGDRIRLHRGAALDVLPDLVASLPGAIDVAFLDAVKSEYGAYFDLISGAIAEGGLLIADNVLGTSDAWIDDGSAWAATIDAFNRRVAADPRFRTVALSQREGVLVARREPDR